MRLVMQPIPSPSDSNTSPGFNCELSPPLWPLATPYGVPVRTTSPGSNSSCET